MMTLLVTRRTSHP